MGSGLLFNEVAAMSDITYTKTKTINCGIFMHNYLPATMTDLLSV